jgi:hypothetical protein
MATTTTLTQLSIPKINTGATGDTFLLADGTYDHSSSETITKAGVIFTAKNPKKAIIKGAPINITGAGAVMAEFELQYSSTSSAVCSLKGAGLKFLNNKIRFGNGTSSRQHWFSVGADSVLMQGNDIEGKVGDGCEIAITSKNCKIINNRLGKHSGGSSSGSEVMMIGSSAVGKETFNTEVAGNTFEDYASEDSELITVKSSGNDIHDNTFSNNRTGPCFRHGRLNKFRNNKCMGTGIRIYGKGHEITGNTFTRIPLSQLRQIVIGNGQYAEEEQNTTAGYTQVRDMLFENNTIDAQDSTDNIILCFGYGTSYTLKPANNKIINNKIIAKRGVLANSADGASWSNNTVQGNILWATEQAKYGNMPLSGYEKKDPSLPPPAPEALTLEQRVTRLEVAVFGSTS